MIWGMWSRETEIHTAPCTKDGFILPGHTIDRRCACRPTPQWQHGFSKVLWHHHDNH